MPVTPKYIWTETETQLHLEVWIVGMSPRTIDVIASGRRLHFAPASCSVEAFERLTKRQLTALPGYFVKVNTPPYLLVLDLYKEIDGAQTVTSYAKDRILIKATKVRLPLKQAYSGPPSELQAAGFFGQPQNVSHRRRLGCGGA
jgi:hypothetical protein